MSLRLGKPLGIGEIKTKEIHRDWNTYENVVADLSQKGVGYIHPPDSNDYPILTEEMLNTTDPQKYSSHFVKFSSWMTYLSEVKSHLDAQVCQYENISEYISAENRKRLRDSNRVADKAGKLTAQEIEDEIALMPQKQEVVHKLQELSQRRLIVVAQLDAVERSLRVLSRQIEVRRLDMEHNRIESNTSRRQPISGSSEPMKRWER